jgi:hypothetical protein
MLSRFMNDSLTVAHPSTLLPRLTWHETGYEPGYEVRPAIFGGSFLKSTKSEY